MSTAAYPHGCTLIFRLCLSRSSPLWVIGAKAQDRGKFVYELPPNVKEVEEVFLDDALRLHGEQHPVLFTADERTALRELVRLG